MKYSWFIILVFINSIYAQHYYDHSDCSSDTNHPGSRYSCNSFRNSCKTFLVYRANQHFQTIANVSELFNADSNTLIKINNLTSVSEVLKPGREVLVPINCSCSGKYFQANFSYTVSKATSLSDISCEFFEGLLKVLTLTKENPSAENYVKVGSKLKVPLRCACPENSTKGIKYLVTYPLIEGDETITLSQKFSISPEDLWEVNHLEPWPTVYPNTTVLVPLRNNPVININLPQSPPSSTPGFVPTVSEENAKKNSKLKNIYIAGSSVGFSLVLLAIFVGGMYIRALKKWKVEDQHCFTARSSPISCSTARSSPMSGKTGIISTTSCLSPDLLVGIKFSLFNYSVEEIKRATSDFSEEKRINCEAYRGHMDNVSVMIKQMRFEDTFRAIDVHSKINHINIVKLHGVCCGETDFSCSFLVFELPGNLSLRDCLSNQSNPLRWDQRLQIAFDIATGLHYLHCCIFPSYAHMNVHSRNIFVTENFRAKLGGIGANPAIGFSIGNYNGLTSDKVDIFAFGVVLLELISARKDMDGKLLKDSIKFLRGASKGGCFNELRNFIDPRLGGLFFKRGFIVSCSSQCLYGR